MSRHWLTSTTALALVLNAAAPLPSSAFGTAAPATDARRPAVELRLAENENSTAAQELLSDVIGETPATESGEQDTTLSAEAQAELDAAAQAKAEAEAAAAAAEVDADAIQAEAEAAEAEAAAAAETEAAAEAEAIQAQAEADAAADAEAEAAAQKQAEADAAAKQQAEAEAAQAAADAQAAQAEADAEGAKMAQDEADAAVQAEADAAAEAEAEAAAQAELDAAVETEADAAAQAEADAAAEAEAEAAAADADAEADAKAQADADAAADAAAQDVAEEAPAQSGEDATSPLVGEATQTESTENAAPDVLPEISAEDQANAAQSADETAASAAAASDEGEVVDTQEGTVTEDQARASDEEFDTTASGDQTRAAKAAKAARAASASKKKDNDLLKAVGIVAAAGLGAYAVGKLLDGGGQVVSNTGDRVVVQEPSGAYRIIKDDDTLLRRPGNEVQTQTYSDGSTRSSVTEADGSSTVTIRAADGRVLRRTRVLADGRSIDLFDDTKTYARVDVSELESANRAAAARDYDYSTSDVEQLRMALSSSSGQATDRTYSLNQIRRIDAVRHLVPVIALDAINFKTGSAVIDADEAQDLSDLGRAMTAAIDDDPGQVFLIEGHTDTVGDASYNLALSDRRAESVALALTEYFNVPPANMIVQGYGEQDLRVRQLGDIRANRRGAVRNITPLLDGGR
ncbi:OmpA family protein [Roseovarius sp. Pro17]|uniref:OmpA family protein n=1 Tax=Roseovarius sp. Pro17 TaxID=3108175 RepID=UPI002D792DFB|nr:OmpA family protein [Roseovarius sp. Pro17]